jgi:ribonuclease HIII
VTPLTTYTVKLNQEQGNALESYLRENDYRFSEVPYARFGAAKEKINLVLYTSGKLVVQGKQTNDFVQFVLEPLILKEAKLGYEEVLNPELLLPRIGVDESGKGDFFGPLCIAGVYVNEAVVTTWKESGIRDSKSIGSDARINEFAKLIRETKGCVYSVVPIGNEAYNRLYSKMHSVNTLLAWGHARVIENLLAQKDRMIPTPVRAISDQFASSKEVIQKALMALGRNLELVQKHKAESDLAVAAASILARDEFVTRLKRMEKEFGTRFPKGASTQVEDAAREFIENHGAADLGKVSKLHFRTAFRVQGLPEPPKKEWRRSGTTPAPSSEGD